ncbi:hypothetical protein HOLleu_01744 [Holothuria leucospilota]|uniref:HTH psq-type domain-containing protein n=1 Tax=Holothuria leucospilota TaxID=206669 RepID=A0A9Q1HGL8_HOLLE|nr:hypothetical protein HOLleu_01744 [Holothuria leucospilota]
MPRQYKRHTDMGLVPEEAMLEAVELVINGEGMSIRKDAKDKGISKSALARYVKKYQADKIASWHQITSIVKYSIQFKKQA